MTRRSLLVIPLVLLALCAGGYGYFWHHMAERLESGIADWAESERAAGRDVSFSDAPVTGFPFAFRREFAGVIWHQPVADGILSVSADAATATMRPWQWRRIHVRAEEPVRATFHAPGTQSVALEMARAEGEATLMQDGRLQRIALVAADTVLTMDDLGYASSGAKVAVNFPPLTPRAHTDPLLDLELELTEATLPAGTRALTADAIAAMGVTATVLGPMPRDLPLRDAIARWAENGGTVELRQFHFKQAPLDLSGEGTLALDRSQQLLGALTIRAAGLPETIDLLAADGLITEKAATTGRMMAENLAKPDDAGRRVASAALSLQQNFIWLGPIRLVPLPVLIWQ